MSLSFCQKSAKIRSAAVGTATENDQANKAPAAKRRKTKKRRRARQIRLIIKYQEMVEAMYERSPGFFKQFQKNFQYFISEEKLNFSCLKNFAFCMHFENVHCDCNPTNHYHVLIDVSEFSADFLKQTKPCSVPCLFTTFNYLFSSSDILEAKGDVFQKLLLAVEYNKSSFNGFSKADTIASTQKYCQCSQRMSQTNFNYLTAYNETLLDTKVWK